MAEQQLQVDMEKVGREADSLTKRFPDIADRYMFLLVLSHRIAADLEISSAEGGDTDRAIVAQIDKEFGQGQMWVDAEEYFSKLCEVDPDEAFHYALAITNFGKAVNLEEEGTSWRKQSRLWFATDGPKFLAHPAIIDKTFDLLDQTGGEGQTLLDILASYIDVSDPRFDTLDSDKDNIDVSAHPEFYLAITTLFLSKKLKELVDDTDRDVLALTPLITKAEGFLRDDRARKMIALYLPSKDPKESNDPIVESVNTWMGELSGSM